MDKDLIVGVVDNYDWDKIKYWANSIKMSGFKGHKALVVYNMDVETTRKLTQEGFMLIGCNKYDETTGFTYESSGSIMVDRFFHIYNFLKLLNEPINNVIITDVRDVVFQDDPSKYLKKEFEKNLGEHLIVGSENLTYNNEPWGRNNLKQAFGQYFLDTYGDDEIFCAGVIAGDVGTIQNLSLNIWLVCRGLNPNVPGGGGPDQAALNILLQTTYGSIASFNQPQHGWVLHAGTSRPAIEAGSGGIGEEYMRNPNMKLPFIKDVDYSLVDGNVHVNRNKMIIVHQWDRVPEWKELFTNKFGD